MPRSPIKTNERVPVRDLYGLWALLAATGEKPDDATWANCKACLMATAAGHEWATMGWFHRAGEVSGVDGHCSHRSYMHQYSGGVMAANSYFGGVVGFIRMARMRNDAEAEAFGWGMFPRSETRLGGDKSHFRETTDAYQVFMSRAWVAGDAAEALARRLDVPHTERGDLYWIERLAETVRADRGAEWK